MSTSRENRGRNSACVACRRLKVRCDVDNKDPLSTCSRCQSRGLACQTDTTLSKLRKDSLTWQSRTDRQLRQLRGAIGVIAKQLSIPEIILGVEEDDQPALDGDLHDISDSEDWGHKLPWTVVVDFESGLADVPGACIVQTASTDPNEPPSNSEDLVTCGILTEEDAAIFAATYQNRLDHFVYRILGDQISWSLDRLRHISPFLVSAMCTVGALHSDSDKFDALYSHFKMLASRVQSKTKHLTVHDVQAFLIGAFWLPEMTWVFSGAATRIALGLTLHLSIFEPLDNDRAHYLHARLYYLVYICDHQSSILYGRPPMTQQCEAIHMAERLIDCRFAIEDDSRILFNVEMWSIWTNVYLTFGFNTSKPLNALKLAQIQRLEAQIDMHAVRWTVPFSFNAFVGHYPNKGQKLHYDFTRLFLYCHGLRGVRKGNSAGQMANDFNIDGIEELGKSAIRHALSALRTVIDDLDIQSYLNGLPIYFDIMLAFTAVFLLKIMTHFSIFIPSDAENPQNLMREFIDSLEGIVAGMHRRHLLASIKESLRGLVEQSSFLTTDSSAHSFNDTGDTSQNWFAECLYYLSTTDLELLSTVGMPYQDANIQDCTG